VIELAVISYGVVIGVFLRRALPDHHLADEAKDVVRLGTGRIGTIAPLDPQPVPGSDGVLAGDHLHDFQSVFALTRL